MSPSKPKHDLSIIFVAYEAVDVIKRCLPTVVDHLDDVSCQIILVDNASGDGTVEYVRSEHPHVQVIEMGCNAGFSRANNAGIAASDARHVLLLNTDVIFESDVVGAMVRHLDAHPDVGAVSPGMVDGKGRAIAPGRSLPRWWGPLEGAVRDTFGCIAPFLRGLANWAAGRKGLMPGDGSQERPPADVEWVQGACMMISQEALAGVGHLDERFFVFFEDVDWCARAREKGFRIQVLPELRVIHLVSGGKRRSVGATKAYVEAEYLYHKLHNPRGLWFVRLTLLARQMVALLGLALRVPFGRVRREERDVCVGLLRGLLSRRWTPSNEGIGRGGDGG